MKNTSLLASIMLIILGVVLRLIPHPANVSPIASLALFSGATLPKKYAFTLPVIAMFLSDIFLGVHESMPFVYGSFLVTVGLGIWVGKRKTVKNIIAISLLSSVLFFLITNFGFWLRSSLYPKTIEGQLLAYYYALPFFRNTLIGDLFFKGILFSAHAVIFQFQRQKLAVQFKK